MPKTGSKWIAATALCKNVSREGTGREEEKDREAEREREKKEKSREKKERRRDDKTRMKAGRGAVLFDACRKHAPNPPHTRRTYGRNKKARQETRQAAGAAKEPKKKKEERRKEERRKEERNKENADKEQGHCRRSYLILAACDGEECRGSKEKRPQLAGVQRSQEGLEESVDDELECALMSRWRGAVKM